MARPEAALIRAVLQFLDLKGIPAWRNNSGAIKTASHFFRYGCVGSADILGLLPPEGKFLAIECKSGGQRASRAQIAFLEAVNESGGIGIVARTLDDVMEAIE